jgi:HTH-type transcriptional regulator/antitoxin HipB
MRAARPKKEGDPVPDREEIGTFVRRRRLANRLTQRDLAELAEVGARFISELEAGKPTVRLDVANRVLAVFGKRLGIVEAPRDDGDLEPSEGES